MNVKKVFFSFIIACSALLASCDNQVLLDKNKEVGEHWSTDNKMSFNFVVDDTLSPFNFYINVRNTTDYPFANLYLFVTTHFPDNRIAKDTVELFLADMQGNWLGSGLGKFKDSQILFKKKGRFPMKGEYFIEFEQAMRKEELNGISEMGIRIEKLNI